VPFSSAVLQFYRQHTVLVSLLPRNQENNHYAPENVAIFIRVPHVQGTAAVLIADLRILKQRPKRKMRSDKGVMDETTKHCKH
jgi:hypothetical protein